MLKIRAFGRHVKQPNLTERFLEFMFKTDILIPEMRDFIMLCSMRIQVLSYVNTLVSGDVFLRFSI